MYVKIGKYKNWTGPYQLANLLQKVGVSEDRCHELGTKLSNTFVNDICQWIDSKRKRKIEIKIHNYDTWNMNHSLSMIILPKLPNTVHHLLKTKMFRNTYVQPQPNQKKMTGTPMNSILIAGILS